MRSGRCPRARRPGAGPGASGAGGGAKAGGDNVVDADFEEVKDGKALVSIKDTGQGIDPDISSRLFSKFAAKSDAGTGLGLFISKSIVEAHGGKIWAENNSNSDGKKGAVFTFSVPFSEEEHERKQTKEKWQDEH